jgi:hypothetical protein
LTDTEQLIASLAADPMVLMGFFAEVGGDPEEYGIDDVGAGPTSEQMAEALRSFFEPSVGDTNPTQISALAASGNIDWVTVAEHLDDLLAPGNVRVSPTKACKTKARKF